MALLRAVGLYDAGANEGRGRHDEREQDNGSNL